MANAEPMKSRSRCHQKLASETTKAAPSEHAQSRFNWDLLGQVGQEMNLQPNRLPGGRWRRGDDRRPIVAGNRVWQLPRCEPRTSGPAPGVAAEVGHRKLRAR